MKVYFVLIILTVFLSTSFSQNKKSNELPSKWYLYETNNYDLYFTPRDSTDLSKYMAYFDNAQESIEKYFNNKFLTKYDIYVHPNRKSLDLQFSSEWNIPGFKSECWMVASGVADQFNLLSTRVWDTESCEQNHGVASAIQQLITHEVMHVYHGQINLDHFFENMGDMSWFIEGVAVMVSGQLDSEKMSKVKQIIKEDRYPRLLNKLWNGDDRYVICGSLVNYIRGRYGVEKIAEILKAQSNEQLLKLLKISERELIDSWAESIIK